MQTSRAASGRIASQRSSLPTTLLREKRRIFPVPTLIFSSGRGHADLTDFGNSLQLDLLAMGAYGHSPFREFVLGGRYAINARKATSSPLTSH